MEYFYYPTLQKEKFVSWTKYIPRSQKYLEGTIEKKGYNFSHDPKRPFTDGIHCATGTPSRKSNAPEHLWVTSSTKQSTDKRRTSERNLSLSNTSQTIGTLSRKKDVSEQLWGTLPSKQNMDKRKTTEKILDLSNISQMKLQKSYEKMLQKDSPGVEDELHKTIEKTSTSQLKQGSSNRLSMNQESDTVIKKTDVHFSPFVKREKKLKVYSGTGPYKTYQEEKIRENKTNGDIPTSGKENHQEKKPSMSETKSFIAYLQKEIEKELSERKQKTSNSMEKVGSKEYLKNKKEKTSDLTKNQAEDIDVSHAVRIKKYISPSEPKIQQNISDKITDVYRRKSDLHNKESIHTMNVRNRRNNQSEIVLNFFNDNKKVFLSKSEQIKKNRKGVQSHKADSKPTKSRRRKQKKRKMINNKMKKKKKKQKKVRDISNGNIRRSPKFSNKMYLKEAVHKRKIYFTSVPVTKISAVHGTSHLRNFQARKSHFTGRNNNVIRTRNHLHYETGKGYQKKSSNKQKGQRKETYYKKHKKMNWQPNKLTINDFQFPIRKRKGFKNDKVTNEKSKIGKNGTQNYLKLMEMRPPRKPSRKEILRPRNSLASMNRQTYKDALAAMSNCIQTKSDKKILPLGNRKEINIKRRNSQSRSIKCVSTSNVDILRVPPTSGFEALLSDIGGSSLKKKAIPRNQKHITLNLKASSPPPYSKKRYNQLPKGKKCEELKLNLFIENDEEVRKHRNQKDISES